MFDGESWRLIEYKQGAFKTSFSGYLLQDRMGRNSYQDFREKWKKEYSDLVGVLLTIIKKELDKV